MYWDHDLGWAGWLVMIVAMAGFWVAVALLVLAGVRASRDLGRSGGDAREILERRLARGDIDVEEYQRRVDAMSHPGTGP